MGCHGDGFALLTVVSYLTAAQLLALPGPCGHRNQMPHLQHVLIRKEIIKGDFIWLISISVTGMPAVDEMYWVAESDFRLLNPHWRIDAIV